jgi:hydrogenase-4 component E
MTLFAAAVPSSYDATAEALAVLVLLTEFAMLRAPLTRSQVRLFSFQSLVVAGLAAFVAGSRGIPDLYAIAGFSFVIKVVVIPAVIVRLLRDARLELVPSHRLGIATMTLIALVVAAFGIFVVGSIHVRSSSLPTPALAIASAAILVSFLLVILRSDVVSQAVGFFSLENGVSVAGLVVAAGLPIIVEVAFFFDLLVAVVVFGVLMRVHHQRSRTLSTTGLDRLRG